MTELDRRILELSHRGRSLRQISAALGVSHTTVMRRLRAMNQPPGTGVADNVPADVTDMGKCCTSQNPHQSRLSKRSGYPIAKVLHKKAPSKEAGEGVTPCGKTQESLYRTQKEAFQEVGSGDSDLLSMIREILGARGIPMYRMRSDAYEGYQVEDERLRIRFYAQKKTVRDAGPSNNEV